MLNVLRNMYYATVKTYGMLTTFPDATDDKPYITSTQLCREELSNLPHITSSGQRVCCTKSLPKQVLQVTLQIFKDA